MPQTMWLKTLAVGAADYLTGLLWAQPISSIPV